MEISLSYSEEENLLTVPTFSDQSRKCALQVFTIIIMVNVQPGSRHRVLVSFSAPHPILSSVKWQQVQAAISDQLPLRNIHWKPASRRSLRTIQELDVGLVSLEAVRDEYSQIPITLLEKPLLNIYVVVCLVRLGTFGHASYELFENFRIVISTVTRLLSKSR